MEATIYLEITNAILNTVALISLAYIGAKFKNGSS